MIEVLKQMVEALKAMQSYAEAERKGLRICDEAIEAGKQAIAELESQEPVAHWSDCAVHSEPAYPKGECDCGGYTHPPQRTEQESVADDFFRMIADRNPKPFPLPQRTWVGLTAADWNAIAYSSDFRAGAEWADDKLKENNNG
jgi:hypothetical protein